MGTTIEGKRASADHSGSTAKRRRSTGIATLDRPGERTGSRAYRRRAARTATAGATARATMVEVDPETATAQANLSMANLSMANFSMTFDDAEVERDFIAFCQLTSYEPCSAAAAESKRLELLGQAAKHIHLPAFDAPQAARDICGSTLLERLEGETDIDKRFAAKSIYAKLCSTRLLTVTEERSVMRRMHYFRYLAWRLLSRETISEWDLTRAQGLIKAALWHRDLMLQANMRLVVSIVKQISGDHQWFDELISDGAIALLRAVDKFDPSRGYRFCTYATPAIRRECYQHIKVRKQDRHRSTEHTALALLSSMHGTATAKTLATGQGDGVRVDGVSGSDRAHWLAWRERLAGMMSILSRREQLIIRARYCLGPHRRVKTLQRLADALKISKERVRQIEISALAKLRAVAAADVPV